MNEGNGQGLNFAETEARLRAAAEAQVQEQLAQLARGAASAPAPQPYAGQAFPAAAPVPFAVPVPLAPAATPAPAPELAADFEALGNARFLEWTANDGRSVFVDPSAIVAVEAHATAPVCKLYSATGAVVTVHGQARDVAARLQLASEAQRERATFYEGERFRLLGAAIVEALKKTDPQP